MNKQFCCPIVCPNCGEIYEGYNGNYKVDGVIMCSNCIDTTNSNKSYFITSVPAYCDGATRTIFSFESVEEFISKIKDNIGKDCILVKDNKATIMAQNIERSFWWVLGHVNNFDLEQLNIPIFNSHIYIDETDRNSLVDEEKLKVWIAGKDIITGE